MDATIPINVKGEGASHRQSIQELVDLRGKVALVTGAGMGIGKAVANRLAEAGAKVMISDINFPAAQEVVHELVQKGYQADALQIDTSSVQDANRMTQVTMDTFCELDILVNNAGVFPYSPMLRTTEHLWDRVLEVNLKGYFFTAQAAAQRMIATGKGGCIINVTSIEAFHPSGLLVHYDASKAGIVMLTKSMALELAQYNIRVNAVAPGSIQTPGAEAARETGNYEDNLSEEEINRAFIQRIPLGRQGDPDDIARVVLFLASDLSEYITGDTIVVDGGFLLS
jgi:2-dehydro-3-deoxy-D-gluconate 5-dehydrogenase